MEKTTLDNGIRILTKKIPTSNAVSIGFWIQAGSSVETKGEQGYSHFLEHMMFKGTKSRTDKQIAEEIDKAGAYINAGTAKEYTSYYINIIHNKIEIALDILTDILENSTFLFDAINREKQVVLEEFKMYQDTPSEIVLDNLMEGLLSGHPLSLPILGKKEIIQDIDNKKLTNFYNEHYFADNLIITAAGQVAHEQVVNYIKNKKFYFTRTHSHQNSQVPIHSIQSKDIILEKDLEQVNFCLGFPGIPIASDLRFALYIINSIFGASMSSILFQRIRENLGLCYSIYSYDSLFKERGVFGIYSATSIAFFEKELLEILKVIREFKKKQISDEMIQDAKEHLKGNLALSFESIDTHMNNLGRQEIFFKEHYTFNDLIKLIDKVNKDQIFEVIQTLFPDNYKIIIASLGNKKHKKILSKIDRVI